MAKHSFNLTFDAQWHEVHAWNNPSWDDVRRWRGAASSQRNS